MENLSREHVASGDVEAEPSLGTAKPKRAAADLQDLPVEAPPPGLWSKLEAQLRREGIIR